MVLYPTHRFLIILTLPLLLLSFSPAFAQTGTPPVAPANGWTGVVTGAIVNGSPGGQTPPGLEIMLHGWDQNHGDKVMLHGQASQGGDFRFEDVTFEPGLLYAVMATYDGATYFSTPVQVEAGQSRLDVEVPIYETTHDLSQVQVEQLHMLFTFDQGGLAVTEVY